MDRPLSQQQLNNNRLKQMATYVLVIVAVISAMLVLTGSFATSIKRSEIRTAKVAIQDLKTSLSSGGVIVPLFEETVASNINSHLSKVLVQAGQEVKVGQLVMQLDTTKVKLELDNMDEEIALKQNKIETRKLNLQRSLNENKAKLELLLVDLDSRETSLERLNLLAETGGTSKHKLKEAELNVKRTKIEIRQLNQAIIDSEASTTAEIEGFKLERSILEKSRFEKKRLLESANVKATRTGLVVWIKNDEGSSVNIGEPLIKIADTNAFKLEATISDFYANQLWQGMPAEFSYDNRHFSGNIQSIINGEQSGILSLTIELDNRAEHSQLRQKQRVDVSLITGEIKNALVVNKGPFINGAGEQKVFVINQSQVVRRQITIGTGNREFYQIKQGLNEGDEIIISDVDNISHLTQLEIN